MPCLTLPFAPRRWSALSGKLQSERLSITPIWFFKVIVLVKWEAPVILSVQMTGRAMTNRLSEVRSGGLVCVGVCDLISLCLNFL